MENPTRPSLYSFFHGLKKVLTSSGRENNFNRLLFNELKNKNKEKGASKNQNLRNVNGRSR